ncbi:MAG: hypothetical protein JXD22_15005 [Sedimentisphaerales bacterium]|nr:hypothetical protein [Sedimentisphaerales bacterium]
MYQANPHGKPIIREFVTMEKCSIHDLRGFAITNRAQCLPILVIQQFTEHSDNTTTRQ